MASGCGILKPSLGEDAVCNSSLCELRDYTSPPTQWQGPFLTWLVDQVLAVLTFLPRRLCHGTSISFCYRCFVEWIVYYSFIHSCLPTPLWHGRSLPSNSQERWSPGPPVRQHALPVFHWVPFLLRSISFHSLSSSVTGNDDRLAWG